MYRHLILLISLICVSTSAQSWKQYTLDNSITIDLPDKPISNNQGEVLAHFVKYKENIIIVTNDIKPNYSSIPEKENNIFFDGVVDGFVESTNGKLLKKEIFINNLIVGREIEIIADLGELIDIKMVTRHFLIDSSLYSVTIMYTNKNSDKTLHKKVFDSIKLL